MLTCYQQIFVQDQHSLELLRSLGITAVKVAGDTRFDRAMEVLQSPKDFESVAVFKEGHQLIIAGSTWSDDEILLQKLMQQLPAQYKLLLAPHEVTPDHLKQITTLFGGDSCLWDADSTTLMTKRICIVSTVGHLANLYRYADLVWIGGGFTRTGIHNIIEPAVFGKAVCFGPRYSRYREAIEMLKADAVQSLSDVDSLALLIKDEIALQRLGRNAKQYVARELGATKVIMDYLVEKCLSSKA